MKKISLLILALLLIYPILRISFFYTWYDVPYMFGMNTFAGGDKHDFPICSPISFKLDPVKRQVDLYVDSTSAIRGWIEMELDKNGTYTKDYLIQKWFFNEDHTKNEYEIISVNHMEYAFLLQHKNNPERECAVYLDKRTKKVDFIAF